MGRVRRGEIWTVAGGVYASKPRPALILQDDRFDGTDSVTVLPLTTTHVEAPLVRIHISMLTRLAVCHRETPSRRCTGPPR